MTRLEARGTKRKCQNDACALSFYDIKRIDFSCPHCGVAFVAPPERVASNIRLKSYRRSYSRNFPDPVTPVAAPPSVVAVSESEEAFATPVTADPTTDILDDDDETVKLVPHATDDNEG